MYKTFTEWKNGNWLEDGEPRKEAYTKDELLLVEMGWKYGFDAGKAQQADRIVALEKELYFKNYYEELPDTPVGIYTTPQKYCPSENNAAYEKGVIDGMAKQRESRVDGIIGQIGDSPIHDLVHRTTPQIKELSDKEIQDLIVNKVTDADMIRQALKKASEK